METSFQFYFRQFKEQCWIFPGQFDPFLTLGPSDVDKSECSVKYSGSSVGHLKRSRGRLSGEEPIQSVTLTDSRVYLNSVFSTDFSLVFIWALLINYSEAVLNRLPRRKLTQDVRLQPEQHETETFHSCYWSKWSFIARKKQTRQSQVTSDWKYF